ncbi:arsenate reductase (glutaredoxin) [uncultured Litoreibacter sp.]|uniref:arsenate reductase (glutaredoxin) n=1 Tax=uncultured Litoreibacter sp. TaxID=1392394 RepID=UPI002618F592|nr:arsenate reductase (glutaredoxin) [uncultured Litoreibacter sp.]
MAVTIWHNPRCSKSRQTLALLDAPEVRLYLKDPPSVAEITQALALLDMAPIELMRTDETLFKELGLSKSEDGATLIDAMAQNPILIERPIVFANGKAAIGRPPEAVLAII